MEMLDQVSLSRRQLLVGASVSAAAGIVGGATARAKAPMLNTQAPAFYRFKVGSIEATVVSDGPLAIGDPVKTFRGPTPQEIGNMMTDHFLPTDNVVLDQNALIINTGDKLAVFETGMSSVKRNDAMGRLAQSITQAGIDPQGHRRSHPDPRPHRPYRWDHGGRRQPQLPERADLHFPSRPGILDRRQEDGDSGGRLVACRQEEPAAQS
jgi:hypothetical protein